MAWKLAEKAIDTGALHKQFELSHLFSLVEGVKPKVIVEIGLDVGGTFGTWHHLVGNQCQIIGLDIKIPDQFKTPTPNHFMLEGDSHSETTLGSLKKMMSAPIDVLFIDGDHSFNGVKMDFDMYSHLVRKGGIVAFHDINPDKHELFGQTTNADSGKVYKFWEQIKGQFRSEEFIEKSGQDGYGIGVVFID